MSECLFRPTKNDLTDMQLVVAKAILRTSIGVSGHEPTKILEKRRRPEEKHSALSLLVKKAKAPVNDQGADSTLSQLE